MTPNAQLKEPQLHDDTAFELEDHVPEASPTAEVACCLEEQHPTLLGRVLCGFERSTQLQVWLPCLMHVRPRKGDRVLITRCPGAPHGVVVGVVDGYRQRVLPVPRMRATHVLGEDDALVIEDAGGRAVLELRASEEGTRVRLLHATTKFVADGELSFEARKVSILASQGPLLLDASEDVRIRGEQIHLNP